MCTSAVSNGSGLRFNSKNAFNVTMKSDASDDIASRATCTTCTFTEDFSNYWTAVLYFRHRNGSLKRVPTMAGQGLNGANGGITVYYITPYDNKTKATAFKPVSTFQPKFNLTLSLTFLRDSEC
jgi:hypothetical protein